MIKMKRNILGIVLVFVVFNIKAQVPDSLFIQGNTAYENGKFDKAVTLYENILDHGYVSAELYFNLGNAYYKMQQIAPSILYYERALQMDPGNEDVIYNIQLANRLVVDNIEVLPEFFLKKWYRSLINIFSSDIWSVLSIVSFVLFLTGLFLFLYSRSSSLKQAGFWFGLLLFVISAFSFQFAFKQKKKIKNSSKAIVFSASVTVKSSPHESGTELFVIHEGTKVSVLNNIGDYYEIKLSDGSKGYLKTDQIVII